MTLKKKYYLILPFFSFTLSTCYLISLIRGRIPQYWRSRKAQLNIFWGANMTLRQRFQVLIDFLFVVSFNLVFFKEMDKVLEVIDCCFCRLIMLFVLTCLLNNGWSHQSKAAFFLLHWVICVGGDLFIHTHFFLKNTWIFGVFYLFLIW